ncbi:M50 family metallopeptidase [Alteribacter aurantiacus]|uniref:M50 family metallopeptidase n=1 Tax=Alteribacter aurantiacus TaxID=254410 RepID=UPI000428BF4D|nr:M50 family metallopeptidase [Alteribacter aurantiacus]
MDLLRIVKIHPLFWLVLGTGIITGFFKEVVMVFLIVFVHEMGHGWMARHFGWRLKKIELLPFGGVAETEEYGNRPAREEALVILAGPVQHIWMIGLSFLLLSFEWWTYADHSIFMFHNLAILSFNLLPVKPLDGGKLLFVFQTAFLPYRKALQTSFYSSIVFLAVLWSVAISVLPFHLNLIVVLGFLTVHHYLEWKQRHFIFMRFLIERFEKKVSLTSRVRPVFVQEDERVVDVIKQLRRGCSHMIVLKETGKAINESTIIDAYFNKTKRMLPIGTVF